MRSVRRGQTHASIIIKNVEISVKFVFFALVAIFVAALISNGLGRDAEVRLAIEQDHAQSKLDEEQRGILHRLEAKQSPKVSEFVDDWRQAFPKATAEKLQELRLIEQRIERDVNAAIQYTLSAKRDRAEKLSESITTPFGGIKATAEPGL
jgi:hypothetical protein